MRVFLYHSGHFNEKGTTLSHLVGRTLIWKLWNVLMTGWFSEPTEIQVMTSQMQGSEDSASERWATCLRLLANQSRQREKQAAVGLDCFGFIALFS